MTISLIISGCNKDDESEENESPPYMTGIWFFQTEENNKKIEFTIRLGNMYSRNRLNVKLYFGYLTITEINNPFPPIITEPIEYYIDDFNGKKITIIFKEKNTVYQLYKTWFAQWIEIINEDTLIIPWDENEKILLIKK
jgi:hypothetical protein